MHRHSGPVRVLAAVALAALLGPGTATADEPAAKPPVFEGALSGQLGWGPDYLGSSISGLGFKPAVYLRYGRFSITTASGFVTRQDDDVLRGLAVDLSRRDSLRVSLGLRLDNGRKASESDDLARTEDVPRTVRARLSAIWDVDEDWRVGSAWSADLLGRGGGSLVDASVSRRFRFGDASRVNVGLQASWADQRYLDSWFGIDAAESLATGRPVYRPGSGLRDVVLSARWRVELDRRWSLLSGVSLGCVLGPAADSPLTERLTQTGASVTAIWRF